MMWRTRDFLGLFIALALIATACGKADDPQVGDNLADPQGKGDSGWVGYDSYEVQATVRATASVKGYGSWQGIDKSESLQLKLVDAQIKFIKTAAESRGWRFNQLAEKVTVNKVTVDGDTVTIDYSAEVDMLGKLPYSKRVPKLEEISPTLFSAPVPIDPTYASYLTISKCSESDGSHSVADYNFHYYFSPKKEGCDLAVTSAEVEITQVFDRPVTYPEYDKLMQPNDDGTVGFSAALVPNLGDDDPASRFNAHAEEMEQELGLKGEDVDEGRIRRYTWKKGEVKIVIDLFNPTKLSWSESVYTNFRKQLGQYTLLHYNGHSAYGTQHLLDDPDSFSDAYQIISMHSCQSYAYYTRQVFRAKATEDDPSGFALADIVATGKSSYPHGAPPVVAALLSNLMEGLSAISKGNREEAPDWLTIAQRIKTSTSGDIMYGVAGVRTNSWQP